MPAACWVAGATQRAFTGVVWVVAPGRSSRTRPSAATRAAAAGPGSAAAAATGCGTALSLARVPTCCACWVGLDVGLAPAKDGWRERGSACLLSRLSSIPARSAGYRGLTCTCLDKPNPHVVHPGMSQSSGCSERSLVFELTPLCIGAAAAPSPWGPPSETPSQSSLQTPYYQQPQQQASAGAAPGAPGAAPLPAGPTNAAPAPQVPSSASFCPQVLHSCLELLYYLLSSSRASCRGSVQISIGLMAAGPPGQAGVSHL